MSTFQNRRKAFEEKFHLDNQKFFELRTQWNRAFALWAAQHMGYEKAKTESYAQKLVHMDVEKSGNDDDYLIDIVLKDFEQADVTDITRHFVHLRLEYFQEEFMDKFRREKEAQAQEDK